MRMVTTYGLALLTVVMMSALVSHMGQLRLLQNQIEERPRQVTLEVSPFSLTKDQAGEVKVRSSTLVSATGDVTLEMPGLNFEKTVSPAQLHEGVRLDMRPDQLGVFPLKVKVDQRSVAEAHVTVAPPTVGVIGKDLAYELRYGSRVSHEGGGVTVPVFAIAVDSGKLPVKLPAAATVTLVAVQPDNARRDIGSLRFLQGAAQSTTQDLPLAPDTDFALEGRIKFDDNATDFYTSRRPFSWLTLGPRPRVVALPPRQEVFATGSTAAPIVVSLVDEEGRQYFAPRPLTVVVKAPAEVQVTPDPLSIAAGQGEARCKVACSTIQQAQIEFGLATASAAPATSVVQFASINWFYWFALLGGFVARLLWLLGRANWTAICQLGWGDRILRFLGEVAVGLLGAFIAAFLYVYAGKLEWITLSALTVNGITALTIGGLGGLLGMGAWKLAFPNLSLPSA